MEVDYDIVKTVRELQKGGSNDVVITQKLGEMGYNAGQIGEIMRLAAGVDTAEKEGVSKKVVIALAAGFTLLVLAMAAAAILAG